MTATLLECPNCHSKINVKPIRTRGKNGQIYWCSGCPKVFDKTDQAIEIVPKPKKRKK